MKQRPIEFRIWDKNRKVFYFWGNVSQSLRHRFEYYTNDLNYVVQQFTGLLDKNGKKIFEGDIIKGELNIGENRIYEVIFHEGSFEIKNKSTYNYCVIDLNFPKVIGNIFENPELLTQTC